MRLLPVQGSINRAFYSVKPLFFVMLAATVLIVPAQWIVAWLIASIVHELGHYGMIRILRKRVYGVQINRNGVIMETDDLGRGEWACALAGPLTGLLLVLLFRRFPRLAVCGFVQSAFNLLPVYPLDGGRVIVSLLRFRLREKYVERIWSIMNVTVVTVLVVLCICIMWLYPVRLLPILFIICLLWKTLIIKFSCKDGRLRVQ